MRTSTPRGAPAYHPRPHRYAVGVLVAVAALSLGGLGGCSLTVLSATSTCAEFGEAPSEEQLAVAAELAHAAFGRPAGEIDDDVAYLELATFCGERAPSSRLAEAFSVQAPGS